jgi:hypothetical protein
LFDQAEDVVALRHGGPLWDSRVWLSIFGASAVALHRYFA